MGKNVRLLKTLRARLKFILKKFDLPPYAMKLNRFNPDQFDGQYQGDYLVTPIDKRYGHDPVVFAKMVSNLLIER